MYSGSSVMDGGTMYQLRNLVNRQNVVSGSIDPEEKPKKKKHKTKKKSTSKPPHNGIYEYAEDTLTLGLLLIA